ncbi:hypothetical protein AJ87_20920 [Rhizobium yanglingense]|nr:hypothetical protein AJ87_20920 [Rhizobium yanglingense]
MYLRDTHRTMNASIVRNGGYFLQIKVAPKMQSPPAHLEPHSLAASSLTAGMELTKRANVAGHS